MKEKGFTLVELIVAIALLGIIVAIAVPTYNHVTESTKQKAFDKIFWSENGVNTTTTLEGKQLLKSSEIKKNQTINVEDYGNAIVVSTSVLLKANYEISVYTKDNGTKNTSVKVQIDKEGPRIDAKA